MPAVARLRVSGAITSRFGRSQVWTRIGSNRSAMRCDSSGGERWANWLKVLRVTSYPAAARAHPPGDNGRDDLSLTGAAAPRGAASPRAAPGRGDRVRSVRGARRRGVPPPPARPGSRGAVRAGRSAAGTAGAARLVTMHEDQLAVTSELVRRLVDDQCPQWRHLPVRELSTEGTVNAIFRIGDHLAARFPLVAHDPGAARAWLEAEAAAARELAGHSPVPTPEPVAIGAPGHGYPLPWLVQTWLPGRVASVEDPGGSVAFADDLAGLIAALRAVDTRGRRFTGSGRGGHLPDHDERMGECFARSEPLVDVPRLRALWEALRRLPPVGPDVMSHGDLTPGNVLVADGSLVGVLDGGGFAPADPALDLVSAWHLLDVVPRRRLRETLDCRDVEWARGMAWALQQAMGLVWYYLESNPTMSRWGKRTLDRLLAEEA